MILEKKNLTAILFVLFLAITVITISAVIFTTPIEAITGTPGNSVANLANGGYVLEDEGFLFYSVPNKSGIYRTKTDNSEKSVKISDIGDGFLQIINDTYYFASNNSLISCDIDGNNQKIIIKNAKAPQVLGSLIFYIDENGSIKKYTVQDKKTSVVVDAEKAGAVKEFVVLYKRIYYISQSGDIRSVNFFGEGNKRFADTDAQKLTYSDQYFFYIEDGYLYSKNREENSPATQISKADEYAIHKAAIFYTDGEKAYTAELKDLVNEQKSEIYTISETDITGISADSEYFYFFDKDLKLKRFSHNEGYGAKSPKIVEMK